MTLQAFLTYFLPFFFQNNVPIALISCNVFASLNKNDDQLLLWHKRFCHIFISTLKHLPLLSSQTYTYSCTCEICPMAKKIILPFTLSSIHTHSPFELIHMDLCEPYNHPCSNNAKYMVTIVDNYSRATWIYLISHKSQTISIVSRFIKMVTTQFHTHIQTIRSNNDT